MATANTRWRLLLVSGGGVSEAQGRESGSLRATPVAKTDNPDYRSVCSGSTGLCPKWCG